MTWRDAAGDLLLGSRCAGCLAPGRRLCDTCAGALALTPQPAWPDPVPAGLRSPEPVLPYAGGAYDGALRRLVVSYKEDGRYGLVRPLGRLLAVVITDLLAQLTAGPSAVLLVPVPSAPAAIRRRGHDHVLRLARTAAASMRRRGQSVRAAALLGQRPGVSDSAGLNAAERAANLAGAFRISTPSTPPGTIVVVDDVITTGTSAAEAVLTLRASGLRPVGIATLAATRRWSAAQIG